MRMRQIIDAWACVHCFGGLDPPNNGRIGLRQLFLGVYTPQIIDA